jgi:hypothetical protein
MKSYSFIAKGRLWVACCECNRGANGRDKDKCSAGSAIRSYDGKGCFQGDLMSRPYIVENPKNLKIFFIPSDILIEKLKSPGICDYCNIQPKFGGYYIAVLNKWYCENCYQEFIERAKVYPEDKIIEERNFKIMCKLLNIKTEVKKC